MTFLRNQMTAAELLHDEHVDTAVDTPDAISGVRRMSSTGANLSEWADDLITRLDGQPNEFTRKLTDGPADGELSLRDCRDCFKSWPRNPPTTEVRGKVLARYGVLQRLALDWLTAGIYGR